ncbi:unnamed protein product [Mytilus edulis]|uniref:FZ domain-containing protein n=1 Tax=Mytilus edulis TaxID=6550 RepID=A0A8S3RX67_MYTED|nr:unnamed protein product [Mytilus edulis]
MTALLYYLLSFSVANAVIHLELNTEHINVQIGDKPDLQCYTEESASFLIMNPLTWQKIDRDGSKRRISTLANVETRFEQEYEVMIEANATGLIFTLQFLQGIKEEHDGFFSCEIHSQNDQVLAEKSVEVSVIPAVGPEPEPTSQPEPTDLQPEPTRRITSEITRRCEEVQTDVCRQFGITKTAFPNFFSQYSQEAALNTFNNYIIKENVSCSDNATLFYCSSFFPKCDNGKTELPCKELCLAVHNECGPIAGIGDDCSYYPNDACISPLPPRIQSSATPSSTITYSNQQTQQPAVCNTKIDECITSVGESWVQDLMKGRLSVIASLDIDHACRVMDQIYFCTYSKLQDCSDGFKLVLSTVVNSGRYICNAGKQGFTHNRHCFTYPTILSDLQQCTLNLIQDFPNVQSVSLGERFTSNSTISSPVIQSTTQVPGRCDFRGALKCTQTVGTDTLQRFATARVLNVFILCIGTKLDYCSKDIRLLRDVILSGSRYLCNTDKAALLNGNGCIQRLAVVNTTAHCMNNIEEMTPFIMGEKSVFNHTVEFCRIGTSWTTCFLVTAKYVCDQQGYSYMYNYTRHTFMPINNALHCDLLSGIIKPTAAGPKPTQDTATAGTKQYQRTTPSITTRNITPLPTTAASYSSTYTLTCQAIGIYENRQGFHEWCTNNCNLGYCPETICKCTRQNYA